MRAKERRGMHDGRSNRASRSRLARALSGESGQAMTEFAIMAPVMVTIFLFAIFFYEVIQVRLKAQEAARYVAWEMTAYPLHDYVTGPSKNAALADEALAAITADLLGRMSDLDSASVERRSASSGGRGGGAAGGTRGGSGAKGLFATRVEIQQPTLTNHPSPETGWANPIGFFVDIIATILTTITGALDIIHSGGDALVVARAQMLAEEVRNHEFGMAQHWGFNTNGYLTATVEFQVTNAYLPRSFAETGTPGGHFLRSMGVRNPIAITEQSGILADTWRLYANENVRPAVAGNGQVNVNGPYATQVDRMYMPYAGYAKSLLNVARVFTLAASLGVQVPSVNRAALAEVEYRDNHDATPPASRTSGTIDLRIESNHGRSKFDTAPYVLPFQRPELDETAPPNAVVLHQRGDFFMGCPQPAQYGCGDTLSQDNPFGSGILPPPGNGASWAGPARNTMTGEITPAPTPTRH